MHPFGLLPPIEPPHDPAPRPAREVAIAVRKRANRDNATYEASHGIRGSQPARGKRGRWWRRLAGLRH